MLDQDPIIAVSELVPLLDRGDVVVLDCRFSLADCGAGRRVYEAGHIPGARHLDLERDMARQPAPSEGRHPLPKPEHFVAALERLGVQHDTRVVAYDDAGGAFAARAWWMLGWISHPDVRVLDGGLGAWREAGHALEAGAANVPAVRYGPWRLEPHRHVETQAVAERDAACDVLLDARAPARYRGEHEPIDPVAGHVPGATNLPFERCLDGRGRFRSSAELRALFDETLGGRRAIAMCGSGVTACHLLLAMARAGLPRGRLYAGSWSEWIRDPERPVARG